MLIMKSICFVSGLNRKNRRLMISRMIKDQQLLKSVNEKVVEPFRNHQRLLKKGIPK